MPLAIQLEQVTKRYRAGRSRTVVDLIASNLDRVRGRAQRRAQRDAREDRRDDLGAARRQLRRARGRRPRRHRPQRRGQDDAAEADFARDLADQRPVRVAGRVVSLIELGAGFHPELTGRENVYLGGGLFGLTRREIDRQFDRDRRSSPTSSG